MATKKTTTKAKAKPATRTTTRAASSSPYQDVLKRQFKGDLMLGTLFAEMFGTFVLTAIVLVTAGNILIAALTVLVLVLALNRLTGAHFNPAITAAMVATRQLSVARGVGYVIAQLFGAMLGLVVITQFVTTGEASPLTGEVAKVFTVDKLVGDWRPFFAEVLGALVFGFGVAAAVIGRKQGSDAAWAVGGTLLLGLVLASQASAALLNPAVALGVSAYQMDNIWTLTVYALAPVVGAVVGAWLYKLLEWDVVNGRKNLA